MRPSREPRLEPGKSVERKGAVASLETGEENAGTGQIAGAGEVGRLCTSGSGAPDASFIDMASGLRAGGTLRI